MNYGSSKWRDWVLDYDASKPFFKCALDLGINFFDTADMYSDREIEVFTGQALKELGVSREKVVVETRPRVRKQHNKWTPTALACWVKSAGPVRISGWTLLDPEHRGHLGKYRSTLWEIHPITKIEVSKNGQWMDVDALH